MDDTKDRPGIRIHAMVKILHSDEHEHYFELKKIGEKGCFLYDMRPEYFPIEVGDPVMVEIYPPRMGSDPLLFQGRVEKKVDSSSEEGTKGMPGFAISIEEITRDNLERLSGLMKLGPEFLLD